MDVEFPDGNIPELYEAIEVARENKEPLILEVEKHLGENWVRTVAMDATDGLARGAVAKATTPSSNATNRARRPALVALTGSPPPPSFPGYSAPEGRSVWMIRHRALGLRRFGLAISMSACTFSRLLS